MVVAQSVPSKRTANYSVRRIPLFASLPQNVISDLDVLLAPSFQASNTILYSQNDKASGVNIVFTGRVKLTAVVATGKTALLRISHPGDLLGLNAVMAQHPYMATARVLDDCRIAFLDRQSLVDLMNRHPELAITIAERLANDCAEALTEMLFLRVTTSTLQRLAMLILRWAGGNGHRRSVFPIFYTQAEIGQIIGASRETVTRLMKKLERKGNISVSHSKLKILDQQSIKKIARIR